jgi:ribosomal-protein-alanine N-acetyltransferase
MEVPVRTTRLVLRRWRPEDRVAFAALNADPEVTQFLPAPLTQEESDAMVERIEAGFDREGFGLCAVEVAATGVFAGYTGLDVPRFHAPFTPCVEVGWRLARPLWGKGFATEAATVALDVAFGPLALAEVVAFTAAGNLRSRAVMDRLGMCHDPLDDFDHPALPPASPLRRHVLYRLTSDRWRSRGPRQAAPGNGEATRRAPGLRD